MRFPSVPGLHRLRGAGFIGMCRKEAVIGAYHIFSDYVKNALKIADVIRLEDDTFCAVVPDCKGVIAFGTTSIECLNNLQSILESWVLLKLKTGQILPQVGGVNLNQEPVYEYDYSL